MSLVPPSIETVSAALDCIPPDIGHDDRVRLAFAVFDALGDAGADVWLAWAGRRAKPNSTEDRSTWKSARKRGPVTVATLFGIARDHGYKPEPAGGPAHRPSPGEMKAQAAKRQADEEREAAARAEAQRLAAIKAAKVWAAGSAEGSSPYLDRKGVRNHGGRFGPGGVFLVPFFDLAGGELVNVQTIRPARPADGGPEKLFAKGARKTGTAHLIGAAEGAPCLLVAEGYATGATCHEATGRPVFVAGDAGNLAHVVRVLRGRYPLALVVVCGDDDRDTEARTGRNPGRLKATEAARLARGVAVFPGDALPPGGKDFNDLHKAAGLEAVRLVIEGAIAGAAAAAAAVDARPGDPAPKGASLKKPPTAQRQGRKTEEPADGMGPTSAGFDRFRVDEDGLWFDPPADDSGASRTVKVCGPLHVVALACDAQDNGAALLLEFDTPFRAGRRWLMPLEMLAGDGTAYRAALLSQGFMVPTDAKRRALLTGYLQSRRPADLVRTVDRVGWHGRAYVLPRETIGRDDGEHVMFASEDQIESNLSRRGSLASWRDRVAGPCAENSRLVFGICAAFAAPMLFWAFGTDGGGFHFQGDSSTGKTTVHRVAVSVDSGPDGLQRWRATDNGLEALAAQHSDRLLCLDELGQLDGRVLGEAAYMLANGAGKLRAGRSGASRPRRTWRSVFLSAGEIGLAEHMAEAGKRTRSGQELRMVDIPADAGAGLGIFDSVPDGYEGPGSFAQHLKRAAESTYGHAGRAWIEHLVGRTEDLSHELKSRMDAIEAHLVPELAAGQVQRVGRRFALVAAAGEMATDVGITGWASGVPTAAVRRCFNAWITARPGGIGLGEDAMVMRQMRAWFSLHGDARFTDWARSDDDRAPRTISRAGWRRKWVENNEEKGVEFLVLTEVFRSEIVKGHNDKTALRLLKTRGHLHTEKRDGFVCSVKPEGAGSVTVYRVRSSLLSDEFE